MKAYLEWASRKEQAQIPSDIKRRLQEAKSKIGQADRLILDIRKIFSAEVPGQEVGGSTREVFESLERGLDILRKQLDRLGV